MCKSQKDLQNSIELDCWQGSLKTDNPSNYISLSICKKKLRNILGNKKRGRRRGCARGWYWMDGGLLKWYF